MQEDWRYKPVLLLSAWPTRNRAAEQKIATERELEEEDAEREVA